MPNSFKGQLVLALVLNVGLRLFTFTLSTLLTRLLLPYQNGVYFTFNVYSDAILFLAREATRNVASRLPVMVTVPEKGEAADGATTVARSASGSPASATAPMTAPAISRPEGSAEDSVRTGQKLTERYVHVKNVRECIHIALLSVPCALLAVAILETLGVSFGAASFFPSMMRHSRASQQVFHKAENVSGLDEAAVLADRDMIYQGRAGGAPWVSTAPTSILLPHVPELTVVLCTILMAFMEPCVVLVQSLNLFRVVVIAECTTVAARLVTIIGIIYLSQGGRPSHVLGSNEEKVGVGLRTLWEARMTLAFGQLAYTMTHLVYYTVVVSGLPAARWLASSAEMQRVRSDVLSEHAKEESSRQRTGEQARFSSHHSRFSLGCAVAALKETFAFPFCLYSVSGSLSACRRYAVLLGVFLRESLLRLVLSEGESFALTSLGSEAARGYYQLIYSLGSLVARLLFRVWENACFVKWSREAALGHQDGAVQLLRLMLRLSFYVGYSFPLLGPPLTQRFLAMMYTSRWATPQVSTALQLYVYGLPLMAWNGLLEAFLRAVASPAVLKRLQRWMVGETAAYIAACYITLASFGKTDTEGNSVSALVQLNVANMLWRCGAAIFLLLSSPSGIAVVAVKEETNEVKGVEASFLSVATVQSAKPLLGPSKSADVPVAASPSPLVSGSDFLTLFPLRLLVSFAMLHVGSRSLLAGSLIGIVLIGMMYVAVILIWDAEVRQLLLAPLWGRLSARQRLRCEAKKRG